MAEVLKESGGRLAVTGTAYAMKDVLKVLPGAWWEPEERAWTYPLTTTSLRFLLNLFPFAHLEPTIVDLQNRTTEMDLALEAKRSNNLQDISWRTFPPWLHQLRSFHFAYHRLRAHGGAMLALDMGTGKSRVAIDVINNVGAVRVLITCPTTVMDVWPEQFETHSVFEYEIHSCDRNHTIERRAAEAEAWLDKNHSGVVIVNHEAVWVRPFAEFVLRAGFDILIVDECHRAKCPSGKFSKFLGRLPSVIKYRLGLTGTPTPHGLDDLYAQARFIDPSLFGTSHQVYKSRYVITGGFGNYQTVGYKNVEEWNEKFHNLAIQVRAADVLDLPEAVHTHRYCDLGDDERRLYREMEEHMIAEVKGGLITASNALVKLLRLSQIAEGVTKDELGNEVVIGDSKAALLFDVLKNEIPQCEPVVVFCRFKCDLANVQTQAKATGRQYYELSGECKQLAEWKTACGDGDGAVLGVQIQAGGVGISMVQAKYCVYMSKDFSLGNYEQSLARVHRPGQTGTVTYVHLVARGTIDETINKALAKRKDIVETILEDMEHRDGQ